MVIRRKFRATRGRLTTAPVPSVKQAIVKANLQRFREMAARIAPPAPTGAVPAQSSASEAEPGSGPDAWPAADRAVSLVGEVLPAERTNNGVAALLRRARRVDFSTAYADYAEQSGPSLQQARQRVTRSLQEARQMMLGAEDILRDMSGVEGLSGQEDGGFQERLRSVAAAHDAAAEAQRLAELATAMVAHTSEALDESVVTAAQGVQNTVVSMVERNGQAAQILSGSVAQG